MNKREFLSELEEALKYELPPREVSENLRYYSSYIETEVSKGRSSEEVLSELGDPRLIARSIVDAIESGEDGIPGTDDDVVYQGGTYRNTGYTQTGDYKSYDERGGQGAEQKSSGQGYPSGGYSGGNSAGEGRKPFIRIQTTDGCMPCLLGILLFFLIMSVIGGIFALLAPVLAPLAVIALIFWLVGKVGKH